MFLYRNNRVKFFTIAPGPWTGHWGRSLLDFFQGDHFAIGQHPERPLTEQVPTAKGIKPWVYTLNDTDCPKFYCSKHCLSPFSSPLLWLYYSTDFLSCQYLFKNFLFFHPIHAPVCFLRRTGPVPVQYDRPRECVCKAIFCPITQEKKNGDYLPICLIIPFSVRNVAFWYLIW